MTAYILDTDMLTLLEEGHPSVALRFPQEAPGNVAITVLSVEEQLSGWYTQIRKAKRPNRLAWAYRQLRDTARFLSRLEILTYDEAAIAKYESLREQKIKIGRMDLRIAATVLEARATLVTRNSRDFKQVPGLALEDWSQ